MDMPCFESGIVHLNFRDFSIKIQKKTTEKLRYNQYSAWSESLDVQATLVPY
jgi:hypothetical protein